jgi:hypothetical protein
MQLSAGTKICIHIDFEELMETDLPRPAVVKRLCEEWNLKPVELEEIIKEQEEMIQFWETKGEIV